MLIIRRSKLYYTASGIVTLCRWSSRVQFERWFYFIGINVMCSVGRSPGTENIFVPAGRVKENIFNYLNLKKKIDAVQGHVLWLEQVRFEAPLKMWSYMRLAVRFLQTSAFGSVCTTCLKSYTNTEHVVTRRLNLFLVIIYFLYIDVVNRVWSDK